MKNNIIKRTIYCPIKNCNYTSRKLIRSKKWLVNGRGYFESTMCPIHRVNLVENKKLLEMI